VSEFRRHYITPFVYTCENRFDASTVERVFSDSKSTAKSATEFNGMAITWVDTFDKVPEQDIVAILGQNPDPSQDIQPTVLKLSQFFGSDLRITSSGNRYVEVAHPLSTKANALKILVQKWGVDPSKIMAVGDNYNDIEMLAACGVGVAVANAPAAVKQAAHYVCQREAAEGVVEALRLLLGEVRHGRIESRVKEEHHDAC
jgi:HAD superfamily hydrolase (TIGR01484 family)